MTNTKKVLLGLGGLILLAAAFNAGKDDSKQAGKTESGVQAAPVAASPQGVPAQVAPVEASPQTVPAQAKTADAEPEFVASRKRFCERYEAASNDIKKSAIFSEMFDAVKSKGSKVEGIEGKLDEIKTPAGGGDNVLVKIQTKFGTFDNNGVLQEGFRKSSREIKKGTPLYNAVGALDEGAQVRVSAIDIVPAKNPFSESASVCGDDWLVQFTKIEPAK